MVLAYASVANYKKGGSDGGEGAVISVGCCHRRGWGGGSVGPTESLLCCLWEATPQYHIPAGVFRTLPREWGVRREGVRLSARERERYLCRMRQSI